MLRSRSFSLAAAVFALAVPAAHADDLPARDQYIPSPPNLGGTSDAPRFTGPTPSGGSTDEVALTRITGSTGEGNRHSRQPKRSTAIPPARGDSDEGEGAVTAVTDVLFDWSEPFVPGLVTLLALFTLTASAIALLKRNRA